MKIAIISDIHDNITNLEKFLKWAKKNKVEELIICGDLCATIVLTKTISPKFKGHIHTIYGNVADKDTQQEKSNSCPNITHYGEIGEFTLDSKKIALTHHPASAQALAASSMYDFVFYGHSHKPWIEKIGQTTMVNPGTLAGMFYKASFATWDTKTGKLELKILELIND
jgi:uncharacterized protein